MVAFVFCMFYFLVRFLSFLFALVPNAMTIACLLEVFFRMSCCNSSSFCSRISSCVPLSILLSSVCHFFVHSCIFFLHSSCHFLALMFFNVLHSSIVHRAILLSVLFFHSYLSLTERNHETARWAGSGAASCEWHTTLSVERNCTLTKADK